jgi:hypothetical protein
MWARFTLTTQSANEGNSGGQNMNENSLSKKILAPVSRRGFFGRAAVAGTGIMLSSGIPVRGLTPDRPGHCGTELCDLPVPIPHLTPTPFGTTIHHFFPGPVEGTLFPASDPTGAHPNGRDPSEIFNFEGFIGQADLNLTGTGENLATGATGRYEFHTDMRFMKGRFVGTDGVERRSTFVFV